MTIGKNELAVLVASYTHGKARVNESRKWIDTVFDVICDTIEKGDDVRISGFGTFKRGSRRAMEGYNPHTGEMIHIEERTTVSFVPAKDFKARIN